MAINSALINVTERMERLTMLVRQRSLYHDPIAEINKLTHSINQDLMRLGRDIEALAEFVAQQQQQYQQQSRKNAMEILADLKSKLSNATKTFSDVLQTRKQNLLAQSSRRNEFESTSASTQVLPTLPPLPSLASLSQFSDRKPPGAAPGTGLPDTGAGLAAAASAAAIAAAGQMKSSAPAADDDDDDDGLRGRSYARPKQSLSTQAKLNSEGTGWLRPAPQVPDVRAALDEEEQSSAEQVQQLLQRRQQRDATDDYLRERNLAVQNMLQTINQIAGMHKTVNELVMLQEEMSVRIDANIQEVHANVEAGHNELVQYYDTISSNQWLLIKVFAIVIAFAIFFVTFIA